MFNIIWILKLIKETLQHQQDVMKICETLGMRCEVDTNSI